MPDRYACAGREWAWPIVAANLAPLVGVIAFGWDAFAIVLLYWMENGVVGAFNVLRIAWAQGPDPGVKRAIGSQQESRETDHMAKGCLIPFFLVHYGIFMAVHGGLVFALVGGASQRLVPGTGLMQSLAVEGPGWYALALAGLAVAHGFSFIEEYLAGREFERTSPAQAMFAPYGRIVVLHLAILFGGAFAAALRSPLPVLVLLVLGKTAMELALRRGARTAR